MIFIMKKMQERHKIPARTAPELYEKFQEALARNRSAVGFGGRTKISAEALLGAILIHFFDRPKEEQDRIVRANVPRLEELLSDEPSDRTAPIESSHGHVVGQETPSSRRKKSG